ncbi:MAG TPA: hypothetical protein VFB34_02155 [Chloroflexota bacterium]|nr:hypothetical protein [Chloroflexota bacterium]
MRRYLIPSLCNETVLETFFVSSIATLLLVRFYLYLTGFPRVGGGGIHIAHALWGGLLMMTAIVILLTYVGRAGARLGALVGGIGFGLFADELGKYMTTNNNYFFRPAAALIYVLFVLLYLGIHLLLRWHRGSDRMQLVLGVQAFMESAARGYDPITLAEAQAFLARDQTGTPVVADLRRLLASVPSTPAEHVSLAVRIRHRRQRLYERLLRTQWFPYLVPLIFGGLVTSGAVIAILIVASAVPSPINFHSSTPEIIAIGQLLSSLVAVSLVVGGAVAMIWSRLTSYHLFRYAMLISILLTAALQFYSIQFFALIGVALGVGGLGLANALSTRERHYLRHHRQGVLTASPSGSDP